MHRAPLIGCVREHLGDGHCGGLVAGEHAHAGEAAALEPQVEIPPPLGGFREPLGGADDLAVLAVVHADGRHDSHVLEGTAPGALEADAVDEHIGVGAGQGLLLRSTTALKARSFGLDTVAADTLDPQRISETSSILLAETPARYISIIASSTLASRLL